MTETKFTPGNWRVRKSERDGVLRDCFVEADDVNGFPYNAEILGDDEYGHRDDGIERKLADCNLIAAAPDLYAALDAIIDGRMWSMSADKFKAAVAALAKARGES